MDLGHNQQQHPIVHSGEVSTVLCRSPAPPLPLIFWSLSAHLSLFVDSFCGHFCGHFFVDSFFGHFLWTLFLDNFCEHCLWILFLHIPPPKKVKLKNKKKIALSCQFLSSLYRCYYPHRSRDSVSPICGIFVKLQQPAIKLKHAIF